MTEAGLDAALGLLKEPTTPQNTVGFGESRFLSFRAPFTFLIIAAFSIFSI
jgi:hypothetical protein